MMVLDPKNFYSHAATLYRAYLARCEKMTDRAPAGTRTPSR